MISIPYYDENHNRMMAADVLQSGDVNNGLGFNVLVFPSTATSDSPFEITENMLPAIGYLMFNSYSDEFYIKNSCDYEIAIFCIIYEYVNNISSISTRFNYSIYNITPSVTIYPDLPTDSREINHYTMFISKRV